MNKKVNLDMNTLKLLYSRYKGLLIPCLLIIISVFLFLRFVMPQIQELLLARKEIKAASDKLSVMKNNFNMLSSINDANLENQFQLTNMALPPTKDFNGILNALSIASAKTGVSLGDFSFQVGDLSSTKDNFTGYPFLKLSLNINGDIAMVSNFINALNNTLPLSEVKSLEIGNTNSMITIVFYYKALPPIVYSDTLPISPIAKKDLVLIEKLSSFTSALSFEKSTFSQPSSKSATVNPF